MGWWMVTTDDLLIDAILTIANHPKAMALIEPQVMQPLALERWMVIRTLRAEELLQEELENDL